MRDPATLARLARELQSRLLLDQSMGVRFRSGAGDCGVPVPAEPAAPVDEIAVPPQTESAPASAAPPSAGDREAQIAPVREEALACRLCCLCETRRHVVFGEGALDADLVFVGEAPGHDEDAQGRPFVGRAGKLLTGMIEKGMQRPRASVYIGNILKCRPPSNRDPNPDEVVSCLPYLRRQLEIIRPRVIVALGRIAAQILTELNTPISRMRGRWYSYQGIPLRPTYHPAHLLRRREASGGHSPEDRETWEDLQAVMERLRGDS